MIDAEVNLGSCNSNPMFCPNLFFSVFWKKNVMAKNLIAGTSQQPYPSCPQPSASVSTAVHYKARDLGAQR